MPPPNLLPHALGQPSLARRQNASQPYRAAARCSTSSREEVGAGGTHIGTRDESGSLDERYRHLSVELSFLLGVRYSRLVLGGVERGCMWVPFRSGVRDLRALVRVQGQEGGRKRARHEAVTCPYASKRPMYDPQIGYFVHPEHLLIPEPQPPPTPASNRLPNGAVYDPRSLTPPMLSVLCGGRRGVASICS
jgi:hypothetical protein